MLALAGVIAAQQPARPALPPLTLALSSNVYPVKAQRAGLQGRVLVAFSISRKGVPDDLLVMDADPAGWFEDVALTLVKQVRFTVAKDWKATGGVAQRYQLSVLFKLTPCPATSCSAPKIHEVADDFLIVSAERPGN
jgi:TonB family protein